MYALELYILSEFCACSCFILNLYSYLATLVVVWYFSHFFFFFLFLPSFEFLEGLFILHLYLKIYVNKLFISGKKVTCNLFQVRRIYQNGVVWSSLVNRLQPTFKSIPSFCVFQSIFTLLNLPNGLILVIDIVGVVWSSLFNCFRPTFKSIPSFCVFQSIFTLPVYPMD